MLEPVLDWHDLALGREFRPAEVLLDDKLVDAYLQATGEYHPLYERLRTTAEAGYVPMSLTSMVQFAKYSLGGRWPSGTVQRSQSLQAVQPLRRGTSLRIGCVVSQREERNSKAYYRLSSVVQNSQGVLLGSSEAESLWGGPMHSGDAATRARGPAAASPQRAAPVRTQEAKQAPAQEQPKLLAEHRTRFGMAQLQAFGEVAHARDPIHLDPEFARGTPFGRNIAQGKLVLTLFTRMLLERHGLSWLQQGWIDVRFRAPVLVDELICASLLAGARESDHLLTCTNESGRLLIEGSAGVGNRA